MNEELLPSTVLEKAKLSGNEYAWRKDDFESVVIAAKTAGLACIGGQPQFIFPDGICELYWINYDSESRNQDESWNEYVERSATEVLTEFRRMLAEIDFVKEAAQLTFIRDKMMRDEINPIDHLWFIGYFEANGASDSRC